MNWYFLRQDESYRWYLWGVDSLSTEDRVRKVHPVDGIANLSGALEWLREALASLGLEAIGMDIYDYEGNHVGEMEVHKYEPSRAVTQPYPDGFPNALLASKAGR